MAKTTKGVKEGKLFGKLIKSPIRALIKIKDLYLRSLTECSGHFDAGLAIGCPASVQASVVPRSYSVGSVGYRERVKARPVNKAELDLKPQPSPRQRSGLAKSRSVGIATIDEDKPFDLGLAVDVCPRSKSYAPHRRKITV